MRSRNLAAQGLNMGRKQALGVKCANFGAKSARFAVQVMLRERCLRQNRYVVTPT